MNPPPVTYTTSGRFARRSGICISSDRSTDLPLASVRVAKMTSSIVLTADLPQVIWSLGSGRMTMLVLVSLAAIVDAMTGLGKIPIQIKNGSRPWSGVTVGQTAEASAVDRAPALATGQALPMNALKARDAVPNATPAMWVIFIPSRGRGVRRPGPSQVNGFNHSVSSL